MPFSTFSSSVVLLATGLLGASVATTAFGQFRPPAIPLIAHNPYFSVWSYSDTLTGDATRHWTGAEQPLTCLVRVDGKPYQIMGRPALGVATLPQTGREIHPTTTIYTFGNTTITLALTFTTPLLPDDLDVLSRPVTYMTWDVRSLDGKSHDVSLNLGASGLLAVNSGDQMVRGESGSGSGSGFGAKGMTALKIGSTEQPVLGRAGDDLRIDWGYLYLSTSAPNAKAALSSTAETRAADLTGTLTIPLGRVGARTVSRHALVAYDQVEAIHYFGRNLKPYWRRAGMDAGALLSLAEKDYERLRMRCDTFDTELEADLRRVGGEAYERIGALAYRQSFAAQQLVADANGKPLFFSKENNSNGSIATVDILYPTSPQMLLLSPALLRASLVPQLDYASSPQWKFPFAPHDLGTYPLANGQTYGGGERSLSGQMPVEETGNLLILLAALAKVEGNADFAAKYWPTLERWAKYLQDKGFDPESQLSTDDFSGHLAHNVNLSAKAIEALGAYAMLAEMRGMKDEATKYRGVARTFAERWVKEAGDANGATRLAFDKPDTWSQKYNLVWDRLLGLSLFPKSVLRKEVDFYRSKMNEYGLPLDNRADYTKLDWTLWTATLTGERSDFDALVAPTARFLNDTPDRLPMTDWHRTSVARQQGFKARSVVGGVFIKMLDDPALWAKWTGRNKEKITGWAPFPSPAIVTSFVPTSEKAGQEWSYTFDAPSGDWTSPSYSASAWKKGLAGFGSAANPDATIRTQWTSDDIWIRRDFEMPAEIPDGLQLEISHDDDAEVYVNGTLIARLGGANSGYNRIRLSPKALATFRPGRNTIAIHCKETGGDQFIDAGFVTVKYPK